MVIEVGTFVPLFFSAIAIGFRASLLGIGGGVIMTPLLLLGGFMLTQPEAAETSIVGVDRPLPPTRDRLPGRDDLRGAGDRRRLPRLPRRQRRRRLLADHRLRQLFGLVLLYAAANMILKGIQGIA
ncbi:hypothetical protein KAT59_09730 [Candidatus Bipolaricaulota bacterium]|nr:hypothetical protein [Candidatus Bipolaricaulota bacterium]